MDRIRSTRIFPVKSSQGVGLLNLQSSSAESLAYYFTKRLQMSSQIPTSRDSLLLAKRTSRFSIKASRFPGLFLFFFPADFSAGPILDVSYCSLLCSPSAWRGMTENVGCVCLTRESGMVDVDVDVTGCGVR